jgi:hypothetical protein
MGGADMDVGVNETFVSMVGVVLVAANNRAFVSLEAAVTGCLSLPLLSSLSPPPPRMRSVR